MIAGLEIDWLKLPMGRFTMGLDDPAAPDDEQPSRKVTVRSLQVSAAPVTTALFGRFVSETGYRTTAESEGSSFVSAAGGEPVEGLNWRAGERQSSAVHVSWFDALEFCRWAGVVLPTEAEWAYAASLEPSLSGDAWQWCSDWYDPIFHRDEQRVNPTGPTAGTHRVARGGSDRATERLAVLPDYSAANLTFRILAT